MSKPKKAVLFISARSDMGGGPKHLAELVSFYPKDLVHIAAPEDKPYGDYFKTHSSGFISIPHRKFSPIKLIKILQYCKENNIHIVHSHGRGAGIYSRLLGLFGLKVIHTFHGVHLPKNFRERIIIKLESYLGLLTQKFISVSDSEMRNSLNLKLCKDYQVKTIFNGFHSDFKLRTKTPNNPPIRIGTLARLDPHKNIKLIIKLFSHIKKRFKKTKLFIAGDGQDKEMLTSMANDMNLIESISFLGEIHDPIEFLNSLDLVIFTSKGEGLPYSVLEAMVTNTPILATKVTGHVDILKETDMFNLDDELDFMEKLYNKLEKEPYNYNEFLRENFNPSIQAAKVFNEYDSLH